MSIYLTIVQNNKLKVLKLSEHQARLELKKQRYICKDCKHTFTAETNFIQKNCTISNNTKRALPRGIRKSLKTYGKYIRYIKNTMEYPSLNTRYLDGINNKLKLIKRVSFGYRKFDNFRGRVLIISSLTKKDKKKSIVRVPIKSCRKIA